MPRLVLLALLLMPAAACRQPSSLVTERYPELRLSARGTDVVELGEAVEGQTAARVLTVENRGELPMGVRSIALHDSGMPDSFSLSYDPAAVTCPDGGAVGAEADGDGLFVLPGGCWIEVTVSFSPVEHGDLYAAVEVITAADEASAQAPRYFRDPHLLSDVAIFHGVGLIGEGELSVFPRELRLGDVWPTETELAYVAIENRGDAPLALGEPALDGRCAAAFSLDLSVLRADRQLPPGESTLVGVRFAPETDAGEVCTLHIPSDVGDAEVAVEANLGAEPGNRAPSVQIISPRPGERLASSDPIPVQVRLSDPEQPADSLGCVLRASAQLDRVLGDCSAPDSRGIVEMMVDTDLLREGPEALLVSVTDDGGRMAQASTSVVWLRGAEGDDDGDGFGSASPADCDDRSAAVYPGAAEVFDGLDNDCDGAVDEDTEGADDDGDGVSELEGDCDDRSRDLYPGAPELVDGLDNDCDGRIDEGTDADDMDRDGYSPLTGDCDDSDPARYPGARELCDGVDNDCDSAVDVADPDGCTGQDPTPLVIGGCLMDQRAVGPGELVLMSVFAVDADTPDALLTHSWQVSPTALGTVSNRNGAMTSWFAPDMIEEGSAGAQQFLVVGDVLDPEGNQAWCSETITVYAEGVVDTAQRIDAAP